VLILILTVSSLIIAIPEHVSASITKPSVPEFTVQIVAYPYDVPTTHSIDPYTGQDITHLGYHVENKSIEVTIKNQPFTPYNESGWNVDFYYDVRIKGHYVENWTELYNPILYPELYTAGSQYTVFNYQEEYSDTEGIHFDIGTFPAGGQVDFQVEAMIGYVHRTVAFNSWYFTGEESGWSNTQTITTPANVSPSPTSTPIIPEFQSIIIILTFLITVTLLWTILVRRKKSKGKLREQSFL
jgi:hypothetical protein